MRFIIRLITIIPLFVFWVLASVLLIPAFGLIDLVCWAWGDQTVCVVKDWLKIPKWLGKNIQQLKEQQQ